MADASVIVPARNAAATLPRTLEALAAQDFPGTYEVLRRGRRFHRRHGRHRARPRRARSPCSPSRRPAAPARARNLGVARLDRRGAGLLRRRRVPHPGLAARGRGRAGDRRPGPGPRAARPGHAAAAPFDRTLWITYEVGLWETANLFVTRETFDGVGGFEDWLFPGKGRRHGARTCGSAGAPCAPARAPRSPRTPWPTTRCSSGARATTWPSGGGCATSRPWRPRRPSCADHFFFAAAVPVAPQRRLRPRAGRPGRRPPAALAGPAAGAGALRVDEPPPAPRGARRGRGRRGGAGGDAARQRRLPLAAPVSRCGS